MKTLSEWCREWDESLDVARNVIRKNPALQRLGTRFGTTKGYTQAEAREIKAALDARKKSRGPTPAAR